MTPTTWGWIRAFAVAAAVAVSAGACTPPTQAGLTTTANAPCTPDTGTRTVTDLI